MKRGVRVLAGLVLVWGALGVLGYRLGWELHAKHGRHTLLDTARSIVVHQTAQCTDQQATPAADGVLAGVLRIPKLGITAPVESGTSDSVLAVAVGHFDSSPWPGQPGDSALLAHDVSYFAQIDRLQPGDQILYQSGCITDTFDVVGHQIVQDGAPLPQVPGTALVLDTCWPTDALWFTPNRYTVEAVQSGISVGSAQGAPAPPPAPFSTDFTTPATAALKATNLTLTGNEEPMGTLTENGTPSRRWAQSPAPLALQVAALAAYFGGYHAAEAANATWWSSVAPGVSMPPVLVGATPTLSDASPLNVAITAAGDEPTAVTLQTTLPLSGGAAPGRYQMLVTEAVHGSTVVITNWEATRG